MTQYGAAYGEMVFSWQADNGDIQNWWGYPLPETPRFVHHEFGTCSIAVDLIVREAQILLSDTNERRCIKFAKIDDESTRLAFEAVCEARNGKFATELVLRMIGRDDLADRVSR